ncbi:CoA-binding protein [Fervidobacterium thailandense]|uniref:CoA-binding protein n=1 Tax=Fervidobacterium thailandense TaxID=1008305 RepID=A0A1E3G5D2_9BACT|nr:CoA-binding protein [Fervidobacterium thailandense]
MQVNDLNKIAVVGATINTDKFGNIIVRNLKSKGYDVVPVTPKYEQVEGIPTVKDVSDLPKDVDLIVFVIPPEVGILELEKAYKAGFRKFWFQPGAESDTIVELSRKLSDAEFSFVRCIMVETKARHNA